MTQQEFASAARYWEEKDAQSVKMDEAALEKAVEAYIQANNTCALATGAGNYVRCTPIEYSYHDGCFWIFTEGGKKFIGLAQNTNVSLAIFDKYEGFSNLHGMQVMGKAEIVPPFSERYDAHAAYKNIPLSALQKLSSPMHLLCIRPTCIDFLCSDFKKQGCAVRQTLKFAECESESFI